VCIGSITLKGKPINFISSWAILAHNDFVCLTDLDHTSLNRSVLYFMLRPHDKSWSATNQWQCVYSLKALDVKDLAGLRLAASKPTSRVIANCQRTWESDYLDFCDARFSV